MKTPLGKKKKGRPPGTHNPSITGGVNKNMKFKSLEHDEDGELFETGEHGYTAEEREMMKEMNEADLEDLKEIKMLEKIANIRQKQGIKTDAEAHEEIIKDTE